MKSYFMIAHHERGQCPDLSEALQLSLISIELTEIICKKSLQRPT